MAESQESEEKHELAELQPISETLPATRTTHLCQCPCLKGIRSESGRGKPCAVTPHARFGGGPPIQLHDGQDHVTLPDERGRNREHKL